MQITFQARRRVATLTLSKTGDTLTINGEDFDFTNLPEGAELPAEAVASDWIVGPVRRENGELHLSLILPHGANAPEATRLPDPITVTTDGPIDLPAHSIEESEDE